MEHVPQKAVGPADFPKTERDAERAISRTGGAVLGMFHLSFPCATLVANGDAIRIETVFGARLLFPAESVRQIRAFRHVPFVVQGVAIEHTIAGYPHRIVFKSLCNPNDILDDLCRVGFIAKAPNALDPKPAGLPLKLETVLALVVVEATLLILEFYSHGMGHRVPGVYACAMFGLVAFFCLLAQWCLGFRRAVLKPDADLSDASSRFAIGLMLSGFPFVGLVLYQFSP